MHSTHTFVPRNPTMPSSLMEEFPKQWMDLLRTFVQGNEIVWSRSDRQVDFEKMGLGFFHMEKACTVSGMPGWFRMLAKSSFHLNDQPLGALFSKLRELWYFARNPEMRYTFYYYGCSSIVLSAGFMGASQEANISLYQVHRDMLDVAAQDVWNQLYYSVKTMAIYKEGRAPGGWVASIKRSIVSTLVAGMSDVLHVFKCNETKSVLVCSREYCIVARVMIVDSNYNPNDNVRLLGDFGQSITTQYKLEVPYSADAHSIRVQCDKFHSFKGFDALSHSEDPFYKEATWKLVFGNELIDLRWVEFAKSFNEGSARALSGETMKLVSREFMANPPEFTVKEVYKILVEYCQDMGKIISPSGWANNVGVHKRMEIMLQEKGVVRYDKWNEGGLNGCI